MAQVSVSAKKVPLGPSVMTVCRDTTGNKAVTVSIRTAHVYNDGDEQMPLETSVSVLCHLVGGYPDVFLTPVGIDHVAH